MGKGVVLLFNNPFNPTQGGSAMKFYVKYFLWLLLMTGIVACAGPDKETRQMTLRQSIGNACGIDYFPQVEQIQYMFNEKIGDNQTSRFWIWQPKLDRHSRRPRSNRPSRTSRTVSFHATFSTATRVSGAAYSVKVSRFSLRAVA